MFQPAEPLTDEGDQPFDVRIASTWATFTIPPGASVASVLADAGIDIPVSCEQGVCGTCATAVLDGTRSSRQLSDR